jgi:hypothetical protein
MNDFRADADVIEMARQLDSTTNSDEQENSTGSTIPLQDLDIEQPDSSSHEQDVDILDSGSVSGTPKRTISE